MLYIVSLLGGIALLTLGGEALVRSAVAGAERLGVSALFTGLVIVGFGTSAPELVVSINAALENKPDIAIGNVIGSNIGNIMLILGLSALIYPLTTQRQALKRDGLVMLLATLGFIVLGVNGTLGRVDAVVLLAGLAAYLVWAYQSEKRQPQALEPANVLIEAPAKRPSSGALIGVGLVAGLALLIGGSQLLLYGAIGIAQALGLSEAVIGLTIVAVGTSLPELAVSLVAVLRRHADVAVGNILGSNIFNLLGILGVSAFLQPLTLAGRMAAFDQWIMLASALALLLFLATGLRLSRGEGAALLGGYAVFIAASFTLLA
ncbi:calcium/sodium antiporter [Halomonas sp. HNIBRBA4712]|uniref:calcium/sodium antiporter n=1 Tax=Halomonas sp. HNIBRBA4712 TaxID=3373087 RepID=UPI003744DF64